MCGVQVRALLLTRDRHNRPLSVLVKVPAAVQRQNARRKKKKINEAVNVTYSGDLFQILFQHFQCFVSFLVTVRAVAYSPRTVAGPSLCSCISAGVFLLMCTGTKTTRSCEGTS